MMKLFVILSGSASGVAVDNENKVGVLQFLMLLMVS